MNLAELKSMVMFQTNNDADDLGDFLPYLADYLNEGYDRLVLAFAGVHLDDDGEYVKLRNDRSSPNLPEWTHRAIADWATWMLYRNGNTQKQNRGYQFRNAYEEVATKLRGMTIAQKGLDGAPGVGKYFLNVP